MTPEKQFSIQHFSIEALTRVICLAMNKLIDEMEDETLDPAITMEQWVLDFVTNKCVDF